MINSSVKIKDLYGLSDLEMMKVILSSGDYFPGFYRFTLGTQKIGEESLGLSTLVWLFLEQTTMGNFHTKEDWLDLQHEVHDRDVASDEARNFGNFPQVRTKFTDKMMSWYFDNSGFDIAYMDTETVVDKIEIDKTYFFMGSLIRFNTDCFEVGYNRFTDSCVLSLNVSFNEVLEYVQSSFTIKQINDLFLYSDIVAQLNYKEDETAVLHMNEDGLDEFMKKPSSVKVFGSPLESNHLPMRYAKPIRFTNFKRGENGKFQTWQSNQNW